MHDQPQHASSNNFKSCKVDSANLLMVPDIDEMTDAKAVDSGSAAAKSKSPSSPGPTA